VNSDGDTSSEKIGHSGAVVKRRIGISFLRTW